MADSIFDRKMASRCSKIALKQARLDSQKDEFIKEFMKTTDSETITEILNEVEKSGHPSEKRCALDIRNKYETDLLRFDDIMTLDALYKSNCNHTVNVGDDHE